MGKQTKNKTNSSKNGNQPEEILSQDQQSLATKQETDNESKEELSSDYADQLYRYYLKICDYKPYAK